MLLQILPNAEYGSRTVTIGIIPKAKPMANTAKTENLIRVCGFVKAYGSFFLLFPKYAKMSCIIPKGQIIEQYILPKIAVAIIMPITIPAKFREIAGIN